MPVDEKLIPISHTDVAAIPELQGLQMNQLKSRKRLLLDAAKEVREMKRARKLQNSDAAGTLTMQAAVRETLAKAALAEHQRKEAVEKAKEELARTPIKPTGVVSQEDRKITWNQINFMGSRTSEVADFLTVPVSRILERLIHARSEYASKMLGDKEDQYQKTIFIDETPVQCCCPPRTRDIPSRMSSTAGN
eukprot:ANDGO_05806.mRNA.1 hypothetical protein